MDSGPSHLERRSSTVAAEHRTTTERAAAWLLPGLGHVLWIAVFLGALADGPRMMNGDGDLGRHITIGNHILDTGSIPTRDVFSFTRFGDELTPHEWLSQVAFAASHRALGSDGPVLLTALIIATAFLLVLRRTRLAGARVVLALSVSALAAATSAVHWLTRPHVFTFLFLAAWLVALDRLRDEPRRGWWLLPLIMVVWVNAHGAFIAGFVTWALYGAGLAWDRYWDADAPAPAPGLARLFLLAGAASFVISFANPAGYGLWETSVGYVGNRYLVDITAEYHSPNFHVTSFWPFAAMIGMLVLALALHRGRLRGEHALPAGAWLLMALYSGRNIPLFAIVAAPALGSALAGWLSAHAARARLIPAWWSLEDRVATTDGRARGALWPVAVLLLAVGGYRAGASLSFDGRPNGFDPQRFPVAAVEWMEAERVGGNGFNYFTWGGYLLYRTWPERRVFIDGQTDFYGEALTREYGTVIAAEDGWQEVLA
ncbi:MAG TPA: hypothetical protein VK939_02045, partial [Longimicrobiales bacterium]|nr:hypothetical protein [Longimicrobiales bacterium]